jgi:2-polyprenyl-6-methoxyphenol hydroxylase-like FAD-dependent oxidoreductase
LASRALIIGGGIGGLATAVALGKVGIEAAVFERAPVIGEVGAGLSLWSNAVKALRRLGLDEEVVALGSLLDRAVTLTSQGKVLSELSLDGLSRRAGAPSICVHRADLQGCLVRAVPSERLHTARECVGFEEDEQGVTARFADGKAERGDFLIGADGIHSIVRRTLHGPSEPRYAGYGGWRGIVAFCHPDVPPGASILALGPGTQLGLAPCGPGRVYWFATRNEPLGGRDGPAGPKAELLDAIRGWWSPIREAIEATPESALRKDPILDRPPSRRWGRRRVSFVGDAIHATTPNLGQGACQAIEDAVVLADCLRDRSNVPASLREYERRRRDRTALVVRQSRALGNIFQWERPVLVRFREYLFGTRLASRQALGTFEKLLAYDSPEL